MMSGKRKLCSKYKKQVESHIWSRFGYKRYVSDLSKGGRFVDLGKRATHNTQYKDEWMCSDCEGAIGITEDYTARMLARFEKQRKDSQEYDKRLLGFVTSMSWRITLYHLARRPRDSNKRISQAVQVWRDYLLDKRNDVRPFSQHVFVVFDEEAGLHKGLGGEIYPQDGYVLSHVGPLIMVGLYGRRELPVSDIKVWNKSEIHSEGAILTPLTEWHAGKKGNVTISLFSVCPKGFVSQYRLLRKCTTLV
jgi:hypothetical protein